MGLSLRPLDESVPATEGLEHSVSADKYYEPPLINVIKFACNRCPEKIIKVTSMCQGCLAHPCQEVCPKHAISFRNGKSHIDQSLCASSAAAASTACPYGAIVKTERPCAAACGMGAIHSDQYGRADDRLRQVRLLRHVPGQLPLRRHRGQGPDLPAGAVHQARRQGESPSWPPLSSISSPA